MNEIIASASVKLRSVEGGRSHGLMQLEAGPTRKTELKSRRVRLESLTYETWRES